MDSTDVCSTPCKHPSNTHTHHIIKMFLKVKIHPQLNMSSRSVQDPQHNKTRNKLSVNCLSEYVALIYRVNSELHKDRSVH